ncbi:MAG: sulfite exporter TauE/SafE family protein [Rhodospirillales bacterium]|nr:MAG: sulfite exporter TauE/SafE family protein [Rhodospirillales bacterium]
MHEHHGAGVLDLLSALPGMFGPVSLFAALFLAGIVAGATHCVGMCGPFVVSRAIRAGVRTPLAEVTGWSRIRAGALPSYHLGRAISYSAFGAVAGAFGSGFAAVVEMGWPRYAFVAAAVILFLWPVLVGARPPAAASMGPVGRTVARVAGVFSRAPGPLGDLGLGVALGFLPCGMIYAALAAAAGAGGPVEGALTMASFAAGTWPGLFVVGALGAASGRRWRDAVARLTVPIAILNIGALAMWVAGGH